MKVMSSCRPILVISLGASSSDLERANSSPSTNITCMARETLPSAPRRAVHSPAIATPLPEPRIAGSFHWAAQIAASYGQKGLAASKFVERKALPKVFSKIDW